MTENELFDILFNGGNICLPYLLKFVHGDDEIRLVNNNEDVTYNDEVYTASTFEYTRPDSSGDSASLEITSINNDLFDMFEDVTDDYSLLVTGVLLQDGTVQKLKTYKHMFGSLSMSEDRSMEFTFSKDDRINMQFCAYKLDTDTNRANA